MPTVTSKTNLGSLFGGKVVSINYNFQSSSEPSSATLTIINKEGAYTKPAFKDIINIPPFGIPMEVVEFGENTDSNKKVLQVELVESSSKILDRELVLIYGIHTDLNYDLNNEEYYVLKSVFIPKDVYPENTVYNPKIKFPTLKRNTVISKNNGINIIGMPRATYLFENSQNITGGGFEIEKHKWITFDAGSENEELSNFDGDFVYTSEKANNITIKYGFTLKNLYDLIISKGLSFDSSAILFMQDQKIIFEDSGTIRQTLSSVLSKLGRSFYIDPLSQRIKIISNSDISKINNNLKVKFKNFTETDAAEQLSYKESIKDVEASHFIIKGDLEYGSNNNSGLSQEGNPRLRKQMFYKLDAKKLSSDLKEADISLFKRVAPFLLNTQDRTAVDLYIYALGLVYETEKWGILYGQNEYRPGDFQEKKKSEDERQNKEWENIIDGTVEENFIYYDPKKTTGARPLYQKETGKRKVITPEEADYYQNIIDFLDLWAGTYFSRPMTEAEIEARSYQEEAKWLLGLSNTFSFTTVKAEAFIGEVSELQFLYRLLKRIGAKTDYTVEEIADFANVDAIGSGDYYVIGKRKAFSGNRIETDDLVRTIRTNFFEFTNFVGLQHYLLYTKDALDAVKQVEKACLDSFEEESKKVKDKLVVRYIPLDPDKDPDGGSNSEEIHDVPSLNFIKSQPSSIENFSKRSLSFFSERFLEAKLFLENLNEINPQFSGPFISTKVEYYRPPKKSDFDMANGVDSVSISISDQGITTSVSYSSIKFASIDIAMYKEYIGAKRVEMFRKRTERAFIKNRRGL